MKFIWLSLALLLIPGALTGCGCGVGGERCLTSYTFTQPAPGTWTATAHYGN
jgi:hypothetical protein